MQVIDGQSWLRLNYTDRATELYEESELAAFRDRFGLDQRAVITFEYSDIDLLKSALRELLMVVTAVVDNDMGTPMDSQAFLRRLETEPEWDWRREQMDESILCS